MFSYRNIYNNYLKCRRNKRNSINALRFEINAEENVLKLQRELRNKTYRPSRSILFAATKPKLREIFAADFRDRVVHHILISEMEKTWERIFIHDSYACREGKGTHKAVVRLQKFLRSITRNGKRKAYYLQLDIKDFFITINKGILYDLVRARLKQSDLLWLAESVIFWDCTSSYVQRGDRSILSSIPPNKTLFGKENRQGLPIGNLTSQFFANIYLNELDQFAKHVLKAKYYLRYVDDFVILSRNMKELEDFRGKVQCFLSDRLRLQLHPRRQKLLPVSAGIDFLGYIVRQDYTLVRRRVINNLKAKLRIKHVDPEKLRSTIASYLGHFKWANSYHLTEKIGFNLSADVCKTGATA